MTVTQAPIPINVSAWPTLRELTPHTAQQVFHVCMDALARPGTIHRLPEDAVPQPVPAALAPILALADLMAPLAALPTTAVDDPVRQAVALVGSLTGAPVVPPDQARFALALAMPTDFADLNTGSPWSPERGATLVQRVSSLAEAQPDQVGGWRLAGPGIPPARPVHLAVDGLDEPWLAQRNVLTADYPAGIDCLLVADDGTLVGLPRTTTIEVI